MYTPVVVARYQPSTGMVRVILFKEVVEERLISPKVWEILKKVLTATNVPFHEHRFTAAS